MQKYILEIYRNDKDGWMPVSTSKYDYGDADGVLDRLSSIDPNHKYRLVSVKVNNNPIKPSSPMFHSELPFEVLRDTIIVCRPFNDPTEFQIVAVVDASEVGIEAAKDNAKFIVDACNNYPPIAAHKERYAQMKDEQFQKVYAKYHEQEEIFKKSIVDDKPVTNDRAKVQALAEDMIKKLTTVDDLTTEGLGFADNEKKELTSTWNEITPAPKEILNGFYRINHGKTAIVNAVNTLEKIKEICSNNLYEEDAIPEIRRLPGMEDSNREDL
jgi:hypothetical protein